MKLGDVSRLVRSKNAGPFTITVDIFFLDAEAYEKFAHVGALDRESIAHVLGVPAESMRRFHVPNLWAIKYSFPRQAASGGMADTDVYGGQFHAPLVELELN